MKPETKQQQQANAELVKTTKAAVEALLKAAQEGDVEGLREKLKENGPKKLARYKDAHGRNALHFAAHRGQAKMCSAILDLNHALVHAMDSEGSTPLILAAGSNADGAAETVDVLLQRKSEANACDNNGVSALQRAAGANNCKAIDSLCAKGAVVDFQAKSTGTALHWAAGEGHTEALEVLLKHGANPNAENEMGLAPIILAAASGSGTSVAALATAGANVLSSLPGGLTVLHMCAEMPDDTQARLAASALLSTADGKSCLTKESDDGALPIKLAADVGNATTVELLSQHMPDDFDAPAVVATKKASPEQGAASTSQRSAGTSAEALQRAEIARSKGNAFFREQKYLEAAEAYGEGITANSENYLLWGNRAACYLKLKKYELALSDCNEALRIKPDWKKGHYRAGKALSAMESYEDAACAYYEALKLGDPDGRLAELFKDAVRRGKKKHQRENENNGSTTL